MRAWIINKPHLQTRQQKISSFCITALSWFLWLYFLLPLFTLGGWLLGVKSLSAEIRWFGGYKSLLGLLQMYGSIIMGIALIWVFWTLYTSWRKTLKITPQQVQLDDQQLCESFRITASQLQQSRLAKIVTVSFDDSGHIIRITSV